MPGSSDSPTDSTGPDHESSAADRAYLRVHPSETALPAGRLPARMVELHDLDPGRVGPIECLLCSDGQGGVGYYLGVGTAAVDRFERVCRGLFPDDYDITRADPTVAELLEEDVDTTGDGDHGEPAGPSDESQAVAALEIGGRGSRRGDWQTRLTPVAGAADSVPTDDRPSYRRGGAAEGDDTGHSPSPTAVPGTGASPTAGAALATVAEALASADCPAVYQAVARPKPPWVATAKVRIDDVARGLDTYGDRLVDYFFGTEPLERDESRPRARAIKAAAWKRSFVVDARVVARGPGAERAVRDCSSAFSALGTRFYSVDTRMHVDDATTVLAAVRQRALRDAPSEDGRLAAVRRRLPMTSNWRRAVVAGPTVAPQFLCLAGDALAEPGRRALGVTAPDRTGLDLPDAEALAPYRTGEGLPLGRPRTGDRTPLDGVGAARTESDDGDASLLRLPPAVQPLHTAVFGASGAGKSMVGLRMLLENHAATDGATVYIDPKGEGLLEQYCRTHLARYGDLDDVYYFECGDILPALGLFDIRSQLAAGIDRERAVEAVATHYTELLTDFAGAEQFQRAIRSPDVIHYLVKALFDPEHGADAFSHYDLETAVSRLKTEQEPPDVSAPRLRQQLAGVSTASSRSFDEIIQGVEHRIEKATRDARLATLFDYVRPPADTSTESPLGDGAPGAASDGPEGGDTATAGGSPTDPYDDLEWPAPPRFDFGDHLDEDCVILIDTSGYREEPRRMLTLLLLSKLWTALQRRVTRRNGEASEDPENGDLPLVNLHVEEAADIAATGVLDDLLSQGRAFGLAVTLVMQFPAQIRDRQPEAYRELLNDVGTLVTGPVGVDDALAERLATERHPPSEVANRLRALDRGEWLVRPAAPFDAPSPPPVVCESPPLPPGHSEANGTPAHEPDEAAAAIAACKRRTARNHGLPAATDPVGKRRRTAEQAPDTDTGTAADAVPVPPWVKPLDGDEQEDADGEGDGHPDADNRPDRSVPTPGPEPSARGSRRIDTALPLTERLPEPVTYEEGAHALVCAGCESRYDPSVAGLRRAVECCNSLDRVAREDIPIVDLSLKLTPEERATSPYSDRQLAFLQAVFTAQHRGYDPTLEYDLLRDSMRRLREYVGLDRDGVTELIDDGLLRTDTDYPHKLYSVTAEGRATINEPLQEGVHYGDGIGDLGESSEHAMAVEAGRRFIRKQFVADEGSQVVEAVGYHPVGPDDDHRLDAAGLDASGDVVVALEAERTTNDLREAAPADFDTMADCDPAEAIWVVMNRADGHAVLDALVRPADHQPRVEASYSQGTPPRQFRLNAPGCTAMYTVSNLLDRLDLGQ